jgi:Tfp pilus assembly protein PilO
MKEFNMNLPDTIFGLEIGLIKVILLPIPLIIGFVLCLFLVIIPKFDEINQIKTKTTQIKDQTRQVTEKINYLQSIDKEELKTNASYFDYALLKEKQTYVLVGIIRSIADKYGFQVKSFAIFPGTLKTEDKVKINDKEVLTKIPLSVNLIGPKDKHLDLLMAFEKSLPILIIDQFEISTSNDVAELEMTVSSFYMSDKAISNTATLSLNDLMLKKEEKDIIGKLSQFEKIEFGSMNASDSGKQYIQFDRPNPFSL